MIEKEEFRDIPGYEGVYEVSNLGRVRRNGKILKPGKNRYGYLYLNLSKNGTRRNATIHRLVAQSFIPNPQNLPEINHKDEDKTNNTVDNLEWCTREYNSNYGSRNKKISIGKLKPVLQFDREGNFIAEYESGVEAERITGIHSSDISQCCSERYKTAGSFIWKYKN